jgi:uncharacterized membrane protein YcaP (DUF421 family)
MYTIIHAILGYLFMVLTVRVLSRRPGATMTPFEFVLVVLIGGVVILETVGDDHSIVNCFGAIITIAFMHRMLTSLKYHYPGLGVLVDGTPIVLIKNGQWQLDMMKSMRIDDSDVMAAARTKGIKTLQEIKYAILERNGAITLVAKK